MDSGPKPTRLWHLTGKKHFNRMINDLIACRPPFNQRGKYQQLLLYMICLSSAIGVSYAFGRFQPQKYWNYFMEPVPYCPPPPPPPPPKTCPRTPIAPPPCPCEKPKEKDKCKTSPVVKRSELKKQREKAEKERKKCDSIYPPAKKDDKCQGQSK